MASTPSVTGTQPLAMPEGLNPDNLDTITELAVLLNRLRTPGVGGSGSGTTPAPTPSQSQPQSQSQSQSHPHAHPPPRSSQNASQSQTNHGLTTTSNTGELSLKEIPPAADVLKHRFQKARLLIKGLPDMSRTIPEQEVEIAALEARLGRQRDMLLKIRDMGARLAAAGQEDGDRMVVD
ncbi:RNA polymerase II transcription mediator complex subunit 9-domain-containing protein [Hypoxylon sp. FL1150]|nr:RNA polymerase II transcription mediator complex subunit 9-domain-containing protein [Hypoxylon sp. FL1150]